MREPSQQGRLERRAQRRCQQHQAAGGGVMGRPNVPFRPVPEADRPYLFFAIGYFAGRSTK